MLTLQWFSEPLSRRSYLRTRNPSFWLELPGTEIEITLYHLTVYVIFIPVRVIFFNLQSPICNLVLSDIFRAEEAILDALGRHLTFLSFHFYYKTL
jgi:hypothetical protein